MLNKIDATVKRETLYIAKLVVLLSVLMQAVFLVIGRWDYKVLLGNVLSGSVAVLNFLLMGITVQKAVTKEEKEAKDTMKLSQNLRTMMLFITAVIGLVVPCFNIFAVLIPLFFPRIAVSLRPLFDKKMGTADNDASEN